jgi:hypothetical protein
MNRAAKYRIILKLLVVTLLSVCLWTFSGIAAPTPSPQGEEVVEVRPKQLLQQYGRTPVELRFVSAVVRAGSTLEGFSCVLKNNLPKRIAAAAAIYSIVLDQNGSLSNVSYVSTIESSLHHDFADTNKLIASGEESSNLGPPGPISFANGIIKRVEIAIDYVEFEDGTVMGPDERGSKIIKSMRLGAEKYRSWIRAKYVRLSKATGPIVTILGEDQDLPSEIQFLSDEEQQGARAYRSRLKQVSQTKGDLELAKILKSE